LKNIGEGILVIKFKINKIIHLSFEWVFLCWSAF
jgi:hypothetical protein